MMKNMKGIIGLFVLFTMIAGALSCADIHAEPRSDDSTQECPDAIIAEAYAKRYGVSIDEACRRLELQDSFPDLEPQLLNKESETFGGLWIQHEPEYKIVVAFTRNGEKTITKYSDYIPSKIVPYLEVRAVSKSLKVLQDDQKLLAEYLRKQGILADSMVDVFNNCVSIDITKEDEAKFNSAKQKGEIVIPERLKTNLVNRLTVVN